MESPEIIFSQRIVNASITDVYTAFSDAAKLARWWGPKGFTNTIHEFELRAGGRWALTMHGPEKGNYENASVFTRVEPNSRICWTRQTQPLFDMEIIFEKIEEQKTKIAFRMVFPSAEACEKVRRFAEPANEENFDRLEEILLKP